MKFPRFLVVALVLSLFLPIMLNSGTAATGPNPLAQLKYVIFFSVLFFGVPKGHEYYERYIDKYPWIENVIWTMFVYLTIKNQTINFVSNEYFRGVARGFEISLLDIIVLIVLRIIDARRRELTIIKFPPGSFLYFIFVAFAFISIYYNNEWHAFSYMEFLKILKMYLFYWAAFNFLQKYETFDYFVKMISGFVLYIFQNVFIQRYKDGIQQCPGPFGHQNSMVMYVNVFNTHILAYMLNRKEAKTMFSLIVVGGGLIAILFSLSRAGLAMFGLAMFVIMGFSFGGGFSKRKLYITLTFLLLVVAAVAKSYATIKQRFENATPKSKYTRMILASLAATMANKETFGVGVNTFAVKGSQLYPEYTEHTVDPVNGTSSALVESAYLMTAAELGWGGLASYQSFLFFFYMISLSGFRRYQGHSYQYVFIGAIGSFTTIYIQSYLEWVLKQINNQYQVMFMFALLSKLNYMAIFEKDKFEAARYRADELWEEQELIRKKKAKG